ncbi:MAG: DUF4974 domain-containing protein [Cyclobacteriaceae bacterium]
MPSSKISESDIWAYVSETANADTVKRVKEWISSSEYDALLFNEIKSLHYKISSDYQLVNVSEAKDRFFGLVQGKVIKKYDWKQIFKYAAIVFVALSITVYFFSRNGIKDEVVAQTGFGESKKMTLPDGSFVWLNGASLIRYTTESSRQIFLEGEAFFEVAKNKEIPFIVTTVDGLQVKAIGTSFNVKAYKNNPYVETVLVTGRVEVTLALGSKEKYEMEPNDKITFRRVDKRLLRSTANQVDDIIAWRSGVIQFSNKTFGEIALDLENRFNTKIVFQNEKLKEVRFTGSFEEGTPVEEILGTLKLISEFQFKKLNDNEWLIR